VSAATISPQVPRLFDVETTMSLLRMGRTALYAEIHAGRLRSVKQGRSRRISDAAIRDYIALLEREAETR